ncbi:MAG TPA: fibronectin type III domain-containing protein [Pyrinomonadaceae bacterium]|nr:fibronectin type III domain-containing protein [Pyrinomonadaceae bacterium]
MTHSNARKFVLALAAGMTLFMWGMATPRRAATWYVAPDGNDNNPGTLSSPFASITRAQAAASAGDTVYIRGGTYTSFSVAFSDSSYDYYHYINKSGISYLAYPGDPRPVLDFSNVNPGARRTCAFAVVGGSNTFEGFDVTGIRAGNHPQVDSWRISGSGNTLRWIVNRDSQAYGVYIRGSASNTLVENCDSYNLIGVQNISAGNTDGFGCHSSGSGNVFRGCRAWACSDDGYDAINNSGGPITFDHCWAYDNGRLDGNKIGFKIGGYGCSGDAYPNPPPVHNVRFCLAARNGSHEFYANHHPGQCANWYSNTAYDLSGSGFNMLEGNNNGDQCSVAGWREVMHNNLTYIAGISNLDLNQSVVNNNSWTLPVTVTDADFVSLDASQMTLPRKADGSLPDITFMRPAGGSDLVDQGVNLGFSFNGAAPDLGCFESDGGAPPPPSAPTGLAATAVSSSQIDLLWIAGSGAASYNVKRATASGGPYTTIATGVTATGYSDAGLAAGTTYYYVVSAVNGGGESADSAEASSTTLAAQPPAAPSDVAATSPGKKKITITWTDNSTGETGFKIERSSNGVSFTQIAAVAVNTISYTNTGLTSGATYYYRVRAYNANGDSAYSNTASATAR